MDIHIANLDQRLNQTVSWCLSQEIMSESDEDESIRHRRMINRRGAELIGKAYRMLAPYERAGWISRWLAKEKIRQADEIRREGEQLMATADAGSIVPPLRDQLRSEALRPFAVSLAQWDADHVGMVEQVIEARVQALQQLGKHSDSAGFDLRGGRLLLFAPGDNLSDGAAEYVSLGFFDVDNVPPWDTWVSMFGKYLISWVPPQLIRLAQEGLDVNPEQCILWANDPSLSKEPIASMLGEFISKVA
jgi:hypothetical protein